jgi:hypothetical protein
LSFLPAQCPRSINVSAMEYPYPDMPTEEILCRLL